MSLQNANIVHAACHFDGDGGVTDFFYNRGFSGLTRDGVGNYVLSFDVNVPAPFGTITQLTVAFPQTGIIVNGGVNSVEGASIRIRTYDATGAAVHADVLVVVFVPPIDG